MFVYIFAIVAAVVLAILIAVQLYRLVTGYALATGTPWQRFLAAFSHSLTIALARGGAILSALAAYAVTLLPTLDPSTQIGGAITALLDPKWVPYYSLAVFVLFEIVRRRPGSIDPITPPPQAVVIPPAPVSGV